jgi:hypothetical protein
VRKTSVRIWQPTLEKFDTRIKSACLRRDACLTRILERELDELDAAVEVPNSEIAQRFIASRLEALVPRKLVTLTLPNGLVQRLDDICAAKRIIRDSFFNRLFFLLAADLSHITRLFFDDDWSWHQALTRDKEFLHESAADQVTPIPEFRDPFHAIRSACALPDWQGPDGIYLVPITVETDSGIDLDLSGLNVYLPDNQVPGATGRASGISFDDLHLLSGGRLSKEHA